MSQSYSINKEWIIIGGGASGLCAGIHLARKGWRVTIVEQNHRIGKKIVASGNGKCNITNRYSVPERYHSNNPSFIATVLEGFSLASIEEFFTSLGLPLIEGKEGKLFPLSMQASSVVEVLHYEAEQLGIEILYAHTVTKVTHTAQGFNIYTPNKRLKATYLLMSSGSMAAPHLGGSEQGYHIASSLGHTLIPPQPSLVQLCSDAPWLKQCAGVKVPGCVRLYANGAYVTQREGDILFTSYGISGLAILDISREVSLRLASFEYCELHLDILPHYSKAQLSHLMYKHIQPGRHKPIAMWLHSFIPQKLTTPILTQAKSTITKESQLTKKEIHRLVYAIKNLKLPLSHTKGFQHAEVATGGVDTTEIDPHTLASKKIPHLYFAGEIMDVDGDRGGFNFHWAWVTGMRVAKGIKRGPLPQEVEE